MIHIEWKTETYRRPILVIDRTGIGARLLEGRYGARTEVFESMTTCERVDPIAIVDGRTWTRQQTAQAISDAHACRCGSCLCCQIWEAYRTSRHS